MKKTLTALILLSFSLSCLPQQIQNNPARTIRSVQKLKSPPEPIDPQVVQDQDEMTWEDYHPIPGRNWADPSLVPERKFRMALVAVDFPDQPFVITQPKKSDLFGNPQIDPVGREDVPEFYSDFWLKPSAVNHGQTINGYWMEQSRGKFGITALDPFGPYRMPKNLWEYGLNEHKQNNSTPDGSVAKSRMEPDVDALWKADAGDIKSQYDAILRIYAGYDETGVWQEFGEMKFFHRMISQLNGAIPTPQSRDGSRHGMYHGHPGKQARCNGASPRYARAKTQVQLPMSLAIMHSTPATITIIRMFSHTGGSVQVHGT